jgi:hypothetical protein
MDEYDQPTNNFSSLDDAGKDFCLRLMGFFCVSRAGKIRNGQL